MLLKPAFTFDSGLMNRRVKVPWIVIFIAMGGAIALAINMYIASQPHGTLRYGVCRTFLDMYVRYPTHLVINDVRESTQMTRIEYVEIDAAGQRQTKQVECNFGVNRAGDTILSSITINRSTGNLINREPIPERTLKEFFGTVPFIIGAEPDTILPEQLFKITDGEVPTNEQLLSLQRLNEKLLAK